MLEIYFKTVSLNIASPLGSNLVTNKIYWILANMCADHLKELNANLNKTYIWVIFVSYQWLWHLKKKFTNSQLLTATLYLNYHWPLIDLTAVANCKHITSVSKLNHVNSEHTRLLNDTWFHIYQFSLEPWLGSELSNRLQDLELAKKGWKLFLDSYEG